MLAEPLVERKEQAIILLAGGVDVVNSQKPILGQLLFGGFQEYTYAWRKAKDKFYQHSKILPEQGHADFEHFLEYQDRYSGAIKATYSEIKQNFWVIQGGCWSE